MKTFFIGNSKMGTTSLNNAFIELGIKTTKTPRNSYYSHLNHCDNDHFDKSDFFLDGNFHNYRNLREWFPDARFVLLEREPEEWLLSMFNWVYHIDKRHMQDDKLLVKLNQLIMSKSVLKSIMYTWFSYQNQTRQFFKSDSKFITVNLTSGNKDEWKKLSQFLGFEISPREDNKQPRKTNLNQINDIIREAKEKEHNDFKDASGADYQRVKGSLLQWSIMILLKDFIKERHLAKNIKEQLKERNFISILKHVGRFLRMISALTIRWLLVPRAIMSPYIY